MPYEKDDNCPTWALHTPRHLCCEAKQSNSQQTINEDDGYTFVATLFCSTDGPNSSPAHYYLKNPDGTLYLDIYSKGNDLSHDDSLLDGKIFVYYWDVVSYAFFCKRPEAGKPIEVRVGDEWKTLESSAHIQIDSTGKFLQQYAYVPRGEEEWAKVSKATKSTPSTGFTGGRVARYLSILMSSSTNTVYSQEIILPLHCSYIY